VRISLFMVAFLLVLTSCGKDRPGNSDAYQFGTSDCSSQFIRDYKAVGLEGKQMTTKDDVQAWRNTVTSFRDKYQGVRCDASVGGKRETIDASSTADETLKKIDDFLAKF